MKACCRGVDLDPVALVQMLVLILLVMGNSVFHALSQTQERFLLMCYPPSSTAFTCPSNVCLTVELGNGGPSMTEERWVERKARSSRMHCSKIDRVETLNLICICREIHRRPVVENNIGSKGHHEVQKWCCSKQTVLSISIRLCNRWKTRRRTTMKRNMR